MPLASRKFIDMIPLASQFKAQVDARRAVMTAANQSNNPRLTRENLALILRTMEEEMNAVLDSAHRAPTEVKVSVEARLIGPDLATIAAYFTSRGYSFSYAAGVATISWG